MMDVQRYQFRFIGDCITEKVVDGPWVLFTDHEAALAAAHSHAVTEVVGDVEYEVAEFLAGRSESATFATIWKAALNAVLAVLAEHEHSFTRNVYPLVAALRKPTPQPEPLPKVSPLEQKLRARATHLQDCPLSQPCIGGEPHVVHRGACEDCGKVCICERLRAHGKRVLTEARDGITAEAIDAAADKYDDEFFERSCPHDDPMDSYCPACVRDVVARELRAAIDRLIEAQDG